MFIESGLLFPFLPGDSLLFACGLLHQALHIPLWLMILVPFLAAVAGDQVGYYLGHRFGRRFFSDDARFLKKGPSSDDDGDDGPNSTSHLRL